MKVLLWVLGILAIVFCFGLLIFAVVCGPAVSAVGHGQ